MIRLAFLIVVSSALASGVQIGHCISDQALMVQPSYWNPKADPQGRSVQQLLAAAAAIFPKADGDVEKSLETWRQNLAPLYHALEAQYDTVEGKKEMDRLFLEEMMAWQKTEHPPGLTEHDWKPWKISWKEEPSVPVAQYFGEDQVKFDNHLSRQVTNSLLNQVEGYARLIAEGSNNEKWRGRVAELTPKFVLIRIVSAHHYRHAPDTHKFP